MSKNVTRVFDLLKHNLDNFPKEDFVCGKINGSWIKYSTKEFCELTDDLSRGLNTLGIGKGSRVGVMSANRPEWNISDFAIMQLGAYQIPLYPTSTEHDVKFILENAEVSIEGKKHLDIDLESFTKLVTADDILTIIYTSGTTGTPKGVMLTHDNLVQNFKNSAVIFPKEVKSALSFLPLSHIFERMIIYLYNYGGVAIYYAESMDTIVADIQDVKPNSFSTVPRLLEKVYDKIMEKGKFFIGL